MLDNVILRRRANQTWSRVGMDESNNNEYRFNSRGFRDKEWPPVDDLKHAIWCVGDSFTMGVGSELNDTWPMILQQRLNRRIINVSMDGGSNDWIRRNAVDILKEIQPQCMIIHWSYIHRREQDLQDAISEKFQPHYNAIRDASWPECPHYKDFESLPDAIKIEILTQHDLSWQTVDDEHRRLWIARTSTVTTDEDDQQNLIDAINQVESFKNTKILHSAIPFYAPKHIMKKFNSDCKIAARIWLGAVAQTDKAVDKHHYGRQSAEQLVDMLVAAI